MLFLVWILAGCIVAGFSFCLGYIVIDRRKTRVLERKVHRQLAEDAGVQIFRPGLGYVPANSYLR